MINQSHHHTPSRPIAQSRRSTKPQRRASSTTVPFQRIGMWSRFRVCSQPFVNLFPLQIENRAWESSRPYQKHELPSARILVVLFTKISSALQSNWMFTFLHFLWLSGALVKISHENVRNGNILD